MLMLLMSIQVGAYEGSFLPFLYPSDTWESLVNVVLGNDNGMAVCLELDDWYGALQSRIMAAASVLVSLLGV